MAEKEYIEVSKLPNIEVSLSDNGKYLLLPFGRLSDIPRADVAEVKHGEWKVEEYPKQNKKYLICRNCTAVIDCNEIRIDENEFDFCPYCGAKMDGKGN